MLASVIGVRPNAIAIDVPRVTRSVDLGRLQHLQERVVLVSPVQSPA